jgi:hypothetical protein
MFAGMFAFSRNKNNTLQKQPHQHRLATTTTTNQRHRAVGGVPRPAAAAPQRARL